MSEYRLEITVFEVGGVSLPKISGRRERSPPTILRVKNYRDRSFIWYKNVGRTFVRFVTIHACDGQNRQTDGRLCDRKDRVAYNAAR